MNRRDDTPQWYYPSSSVAAHHGSAEGADGEGYSMAHHHAVPVSQYFQDERAHDFVREQDGGPCISVHQGRSSDSDPDIVLEGLSSTGQPVQQSRNSSGRNASPRTAYRQVEQRLGAMRTERLAYRTDVGYAAAPTRQRQTVYNADQASARIANRLPRQQQRQDRYLEQVGLEGADPSIGLIRHDNGQTHQTTDCPGGHIQYLEDGGSVAYQYDSSEDLWQNTEGDAGDHLEHL